MSAAVPAEAAAAAAAAVCTASAAFTAAAQASSTTHTLKADPSTLPAAVSKASSAAHSLVGRGRAKGSLPALSTNLLLNSEVARCPESKAVKAAVVAASLYPFSQAARSSAAALLWARTRERALEVVEVGVGGGEEAVPPNAACVVGDMAPPPVL